MTARIQYETEMRENNTDYNITLKEFMNWLKENCKKANFKKSLKEGMYETAVDFSVPVIMVKYLGKRL